MGITRFHVFTLCLIGTFAIGSTANGQISGKVEIDGSSTVYPISEAAAELFKKKYPKIDVTVAVSGTGGGFKRFTKGEIDISDASRPIKDNEFKLCRQNDVQFIEIPVAYDGLSIVINPNNKFVDSLSIEQLKKIFLAENAARTWKDVNVAWPNEPIKIYAPGKDSGTFDYFFGDVVAKKSGTPRSEGVSFSEDDNALVNGVSNEEFAIGFFGCSYYFENKDKLKAVKIVNPQTNTAVAPSPNNIESGEYAPFSRPLFIYVSIASLKSPAVKKFVEFYLENADVLAEQVDYVPLPEDLYDRAIEHYEDRLDGTHYLTSDLEKRSGSLSEIYEESNLVK